MEILQRYYDYLCGEYKNKSTIKNKKNLAKRLLDFTQGVLTEETIQNWSKHLNEKYEHNTINTYRQLTNDFLDYRKLGSLRLKTLGTIETDQVTLTENEMQLVFDYIKDKPEENLYVKLLWNGLRPNDIINIKISNIHDDVLHLKDTKTGNRHVILSPDTLQAIDIYKKVRTTPFDEFSDYLVICNRSNWQYKPFTTILPIEKSIKRLIKEVGIKKDVTPYTIRRTSVTLRLDKYSIYYAGDVKLVQHLFGHKKPETTLRYDKKRDEDLRIYLRNTGNTEKNLSKREKDLFDSQSDDSFYTLGTPQSSLNSCENDSFTFSFTIFYFEGFFIQTLLENRGRFSFFAFNHLLINLPQPLLLISWGSTA